MASVAAASSTAAAAASHSARGPFLNRFTAAAARRPDDADDGGVRKLNKKTKAALFRSPRARGRTASVETLQSAPSSDNLLAASAVSVLPLEPTITTNDGASATSNNLMQWLETACPGDCVPKILAFCGPQQTAALSRTNRHWLKTIVRNEATWRVLCEELYKWKPGDREPSSWYDFYRNSPCVPTDYSSIPKALQMATASSHRVSHHQLSRRLRSSQLQVRSIRVLLRPGKYVLKQAIHIQAVPGVVVSLETAELPKNLYRNTNSVSDINSSEALATSNSRPIIMEQPLPLELPRTTPASSSKPSFRNLFRCNRQPNSDPESSVTDDPTDWDGDWWHDAAENSNNHSMSNHATLLLRSRRHNEPAFRIQQGLLRLRNIEIQHNSHGLDIWNGNAAVQIQPPLPPPPPPADAVEANPTARPTAILERCLVTSQSGRGIVNIDGGKVVIRRCAVADCAATGVYVGGPGSSAVMEESDVVRNGVGHHQRAARGGRGIARGHSGIYLEQGVARIRDCHVAHNTLSGISVVSPDNAVLHLSDSSLVRNGTHQLELPPPGSASRQRSTTANSDNVLDATGDAELRSGLLLAGGGSSSATEQPHQHHRAAAVPENHGPLPF